MPRSTHLRQLPAVFWILLALTAAVRLPGVTRPLLGSFATKNCVYAMMARNWAQGRASPWYPTVDVLAGGRRGWQMIEFPVSAYLSGGLCSMFGGPLDLWGRLTAVAMSSGSVVLMYLFVRRRHGDTAAAAAALALALAPVCIIYGQSFMLQASVVLFTMAAFYALDRHLADGRLPWLVLAAAALALLLLTKIYMVVILLPLGWMVFRSTATPRRRVLSLAALGLAIVPAAIWCFHAFRIASPDGPFADRIYFSLRRSVADHFPPHPLLFSADFYRQLIDDLTGVVLTPIGFALLLAGLLDRRWRSYIPWLAAMVVLVLALPRKFYEMNYYATATLPPLCILIGLGWQVARERLRPGRIAVAVLLLVSVVLSMRYAARPAFVTPAEDRGVTVAAAAVRQLTAADEPVVTMHGTTIDLLYYCDRPGWALDPKDPNLATTLEQCRRQGARYIVVVGEAPRHVELGRVVVRGRRFCVFR